MTRKITNVSYSLVVTLLSIAFIAGLGLSYSMRYDFKTLDDTRYKFSSLKGDVVIVNYFAEWCAPCLREIPELNEFYHQKPQNVHLFAISYDNLTSEQLTALEAKYAIEFPIINHINTPFPFSRPDFLPATFVLKPDGELAGQLLGEQTIEALFEAVDSVSD